MAETTEPTEAKYNCPTTRKYCAVLKALGTVEVGLRPTPAVGYLSKAPQERIVRDAQRLCVEEQCGIAATASAITIQTHAYDLTVAALPR